MKKIILILMLIVANKGAIADSAYPVRPVKLVVGFSPGGPTDIAARILAKHLSTDLNGSFFIENKPGAGGNIATNVVGEGKNDGYTGLVSGINLTINPFMTEGLKVDSLRGFVPVRIFATSPTILVVRKDFPAQNYADFLQELKNHPGKYSAAAQGASPVLAIELFKQRTGTQVVSVKYKGAAPAMIDLIGGQVDFSFASLGSVMPQIKDGKVKALAIASPERRKDLPNVSTFKELGMPDFKFDSWVGILFPQGTSAEIVKKIDQSISKLVLNEEYKIALSKVGMEPVTDSSPKKFENVIQDEMALYKKLSAGVRN